MQTGQVTLTDISKFYGSVCVLDSINISVKAGEFLVLLGPSGCGKSTLLRMIAGLDTISSGQLQIDARAANDLHPRDRDIAMVFQNYALYPHMTVGENIAYPLRIARTDKATLTKAVAEVAELLELSAFLDRKPADLSGGQRQRVAMGRAIIRRPAVFLMDEPLSNLDARLRQLMRIEIRDLQKRLGVTMIYVTHDQVEAMTMADRIVVLHDGCIQQIGTPNEIYRTPANLFVAGFIGAPPTNFVEEPGLVSTLAGAAPSDANDLVAGIRPEHIVRGSSCDESHAVLSAHCVAVESLGSETLCHLDISNDRSPQSETNAISTRMAARWQGDHTGLLNTKTTVAIPYEQVLMFDRKTGQRIGV
jgi:sn-glycerol 3-phosphate transport system ATP-binding protein